jgi:hypothetical protein
MSQPRYVVYLDLLGFSGFVRSHEVDDVLRLYDRLFRAVLFSLFTQAQTLVGQIVAAGHFDAIQKSAFWQHFERVGKLLCTNEPIDSKSELDAFLAQLFPYDFLVLSDSLVFISAEAPNQAERMAGLEISVRLAREFVAAAFLHGLPMRGAISFGDLHIDRKRQVYFGRAFLEAMAHEREQEWIGCCLTPSLAIPFEEYKAEYGRQAEPWKWKVTPLGPLSRHTIHPYPVPVKGRETKDQLIVNWAGAIIGKIKVHEAMFSKVLTGIPDHDRKWQNTYAYLDWWMKLLENQLKKGKVVV